MAPEVESKSRKIETVFSSNNTGIVQHHEHLDIHRYNYGTDQHLPNAHRYNTGTDQHLPNAFSFNTATDQHFPNNNRYNIETPTDQHLSNTQSWNNTETYHGYKPSSNPALLARMGTTYPWYHYVRETIVSDGQTGGWYVYNQRSADTNNYNRIHTSYQTIHDVNNTNGRCSRSYPTLTSARVNVSSHHVNGTWTNGTNSWRNETAVQEYYGNTVWADNTVEQRGGQTAQKHDTSHRDSSQYHVQLNGLGQWNNHKLYGGCFQHKSLQSQNCNTVSQTNEAPDGATRKRKMTGGTEATPNDEVASAPKVDKRALYSKFRVMKRTERSPSCNESSKVTPILWRVKLDDKTMVDVNHEDGLPNNAKMPKIVTTLTPVKENEAAATIGNIKYITLENMRVVRRKLEVVLAMQHVRERQERLQLEAKVRAKVKVNAKERARKDKKCNDRKRLVKIGL
ncbi:uncharacterized protein LOC117339845 [Pecten maximus]|uniref:uncharacterized protein LOC117339845 n=1 Tax=Pecten maximus TaxID=6579 RepID=UPI001458DA98|nr:uncharacterized protein LOC117339845 [Pecten maximus]